MGENYKPSLDTEIFFFLRFLVKYYFLNARSMHIIGGMISPLVWTVTKKSHFV